MQPIEIMEIVYQGQPVKVEVYENGKHPLYKAILPAQATLFLTKALANDKTYFWTSVPEGRLEQAMEIGELIDRSHNTPTKPSQQSLF